MGYSKEIMQDEMLASAEDLVRPSTQLSAKIFSVSDFEVHPLNSDLEAWVPADTSRVMLSLAVQMDGNSDEIEGFRKCVLE
jgi:hypothetical protein